ncbi:MAG TPA: metallophosphoesterase [Thermoanaerobaculia bacterium]|nr:metallophosphoesterase [Thermoanaerobaculia bacterium]
MRWIYGFLLFVTFPLIARDWQQCPALITLTTTETIYALGDTHADYKRTSELLVAAKLMPSVPSSPDQATWSGGRSILIVTGDMIDKWKHSLDVIALMRALTASAASQGGRVVISTGNHEAEFLADPKSSKTQEFQGELKAAGIKPLDVANGTDAQGIGKFLLCLPFASRANDWFFAHAGSTKGRTLAQLISDLQTGFDADGYNAKVLLGDMGLLEARMKPPWWEKDGDKPEQSIARLLGYADALGVKHIVFGHQPGSYTFNDGSARKKGTMFQNFHGLVFLIDMGMSKGVDYSKGGVLRITSGDATAMCADGTTKQLWPDGSTSFAACTSSAPSPSP